MGFGGRRMYSVFSELGTLGCWKKRTKLQYLTCCVKQRSQRSNGLGTDGITWSKTKEPIQTQVLPPTQGERESSWEWCQVMSRTENQRWLQRWCASGNKNSCLFSKLMKKKTEDTFLRELNCVSRNATYCHVNQLKFLIAKLILIEWKIDLCFPVSLSLKVNFCLFLNNKHLNCTSFSLLSSRFLVLALWKKVSTVMQCHN